MLHIPLDFGYSVAKYLDVGSLRANLGPALQLFRSYRIRLIMAVVVSRATRLLRVLLLQQAWMWLWLFGSIVLVQSRPMEASRISRNQMASTGSSSSTDQPVLTPRLLDRYYQDKDLVLVETPPTSSGWFHALKNTATNSAFMQSSSSTGAAAQVYQKMAPHVATFVGISAWLRLAYRLRRRRQMSAAPTNATMPTTTILASSSSSDINGHDDTKITRAAADSMVQAVEAQWQQRYHEMEMEQAAVQQQWNDTMAQLAATVQHYTDSQLELSQLQMMHNATLEQLSVSQRQCADSDKEATLASEQQQALAVQLAAVQEQLDDTRQQLDTMQQVLDEALAQRDEQRVQVASLNDAVAAANETAAHWQSVAQTRARLLTEYQQQAQHRHVGELRRFSESVLALVDAEQSEFMADVQARIAQLRSVYDLTDSASAV
jgi:hypothetical protein